MVKKIFAIIGIVVGSVTAFVGAVLGVMAAMGKFKTPIVWPQVLEFVNNDQVVIAGVPNGLGDEPTIHSFMLKGKNSSSKHDVNKTVCYIWFENNIGADLITLCDENGNPLTPTTNNRYKVNCNEPIYFTTNPIEDNAVTDGRVVLMARSANDKIQPDQPITIWIDREVDSVFVDGWGTTSTEGSNTQQITVGVDIPFDFNYVVDTPLSWKPISKESAKEIELYYVATGYNNDYIKVTESEVNNPSSPLNRILTYEDGKFTFKSTEAGNHSFKIATFKTYEYKTDYLASIEGLPIDNPNYHRVSSVNIDAGVSNMAVTTLDVNVENIDISEVGFLSSNVVLNLYSKNDYITLDGTSGIDGAKDNNLELFMKKGEDDNAVLDYTRFDEVKMIDFTTANVWTNKEPEFVSILGTKLEFETLMTILNDADQTNNISTISLAENLKVIDYVIYNSAPYYSNNGVTVYDTESKTAKVLSAGSYLNFYVDNGENSFKISNLTYSATEIGKGKTKSWNIVTQNELNEDESLKLGILVVNNKGKFFVDNFFDSIPVNLNEVALSYKFNTNSEDLDITFSAEKANYDDSALDFNDIVSITGGSYDACVFVTDITEGVENCIVDVISSITYVGSKTYALVGYIDDIYGKFVNKVRVNGNVSSENNSCEIIMLQLKNGYNKDNNRKETASDIVEANLAGGITFDETGTVKLFGDNAVTINAKYLLNKSLLNVKYYNNYVGVDEENIEEPTFKDGYSVYENTTSHEIVITSTNSEMLTKVGEYYNLESEYSNLINVSYDNKITITSATKNETIIITYDATNSLNDENIPIVLTLTGMGDDVEFPKLYILSGSPDRIVFNSDDEATSQIVLSKTKEDAAESNNYIKISVDYYNEEYRYAYSLVKEGGETAIDVADRNIFNESISKSTNMLFQDAVDKGQSLSISYDALDKSIFNSDLIKTDLFKAARKAGSTVLAVTIGKTTQYIKIVVDTSAFTLTTTDDKLTFEDTNSNHYPKLDDKMVQLNCGETPMALSVENLVYIENVKSISYGGGTLVVFGDKETGWELKKEVGREYNGEEEVVNYETVLTISPTEIDWEFEKPNAYIPLTISFDVVTIAGTKSIQLRFTPSVSVAINENWQVEENQKISLYAGTNVMLYSETIGTTPVFNINSDGNNVSIKINNSTINNLGSYTIPESYVGQDIAIEILMNDVTITTFYNFTVKANVIATLKTEDLESENNYDILTLYTLKAFKTDVTYGNSLEDLYTTLNADGDSLDNLVDITDTTKLSINIDNKEENSNPELSGESELNIGQVIELNKTKQRKVYLMYTYGESGETIVVNSGTITIINSYDKNLTETATGEGETKTYTYKTKKLYEVFAAVTAEGFELVSISADNLTFTLSADKQYFIIDSFITQNLDEVLVAFTFKKGEQTLTYNREIKIVPYTPEEKDDINKAFSGSTYDLLTSRYDESALISDVNVEKLLITAIKDENGNDITTNVINGTYSASGYIKGNLDNHCFVKFNEISIAELIIFVEYELTYSDGTTYSYQRELKIENRQKISIQYPENDLKLERGTFKFIEGYEEDAKILSGQTSVAPNGIYTLSNVKYEPLLIYTDASYVLDLANDSNKKLSRVVVENLTTTDVQNTNVNPTITLIAYENNFGMSDYISKINDKHNTNQISFGLAYSGMFGTLIFKIESVSGYFEYYNVYVYCNGESTKINTTNNLKVVAYQNTIDYADKYTDTSVVSIQIDQNTTLKEIVDTLSTMEVASNKVFNTTFNRTYDSTSLYLLDVESVGNDYGYNVNSHWSTIKDADKIILTNQFNIITIGLLYSKGFARYTYGTITIYVQPKEGIEIANSLNYAVPNGRFNAEIASNANEILNPFTAGTIGVQIEDQGLQSQGYKLVNGAIVSDSLEIIDGVEIEDEDKIIYVVGNAIKLNKKVAKALTFTVKYSFDIDNGTICFVTYTYGATQIPSQADLNNTSTTIGAFVGDKFANEIDLNSSDNYKKFFGTYDIENGFGLEYTGGEVDVDDTKLTFKQTHETQSVKVTITYNTFVDENGNSGVSRSFNFVVLPGVFVDDTSTADGTGLSTGDSKRKLTSLTYNYEDKVGSELEFNYYSKETDVDGIAGNGNDSRDYHTYIVGGLKIYTVDESYLELTFDELDYVVKDGKRLNPTNNNILVKETENVGFAHTPQQRFITMNVHVIKVDNVNGNKEYTSRYLYLKVAQTYTSVKATYLTDGANHENVIGGDSSITNLHEKLLGTASVPSVRFKLYGTEFDTTTQKYKEVDEYNFAKMGFTTKTNPNFINFAIEDNATLRNYGTEPNTTTGIVFKNVTTNTMCGLTLNNNAGMPEIVYNYQIMAGTKFDALDYSKTNANYGTYVSGGTKEYISILLDDATTDISNSYKSKKYILGSMIDLKNQGAFNVAEFKISGSNLVTPETKPTLIEDGEYVVIEDGEYVVKTGNVVGGYTNAIQYMFERNNYQFFITYDIDFKTVDLIIARAAGGAKTNFVITLSAGGVNGEKSLVNGLEIALNNFEVYSEYEDVIDTSIYSGYLIDLITNDEYTKFVETDLTTENNKLEYELAESTYIIEGQQYTINANENDNDLFTFDDTTNKIQTKAVGSNVLANIIFKVKRNNYVLKEIKYSFYIYMNMQFVVNGDVLADNIDNSNPETYFVLTNKNNGTQFPLNVNFIPKADVDTEPGGNVDPINPSNTSRRYYNVLAFDLYRKKIQGNNLASENELRMSRDSVVVELYSNIDSSILTVNSTGITFYKDYTGDIELKLKVETDNGTYYVIWTIYVTGILDANYSSSEPEFARIQDNALPFNSGREVKLINSSNSGDGVAIVMTSDIRFRSDYIDYGKVKVSYEYKIITFNNETRALSNEALFNINNDNDFVIGSDNGVDEIDPNTSIQMTLNLPGVPNTTAQLAQSYYVTYKVYVEYLGLTYDDDPEKNKVEVFYVTYEVINYQTASTYNKDDGTSSANVNVDHLSDNILPLFYYDETYTASSIKYKFAYIDNKITLTVNNGLDENTYTYNEVQEQFNADGADKTISYKYLADKTLEKIDNSGENNNVRIDKGEWETTTKKDKTIFTFTKDFGTIFDYKEYIDKYLKSTNKDKTYIALGSKNFELQEFDTGVYGINLNPGSGVLFSNYMNAKLAMVDNGVETLIVDAYTEENTSGFRLFTDKSIVAKTNDGAGIRLSTMFLPGYFTKNTGLADNDITISDSVIGYGEPNSAWVDQGSPSTADTSVYATISIPNGSGYNNYQVKKVTYNYSVTGKIYNITQSFYYLKETTVSTLVVPDYNAVGIETTFYKITYNPNSSGDVVLDLSKAFKVWYMNSNKLECKPAADYSTTRFNNEAGVVNPTHKASFSPKTEYIAISASTLDAYKAKYPTAKNYPTINATITADGVTLRVNIVFSLYSYVKVEADQNTSGNTEIDLVSKLYIPILNDSKIEYKELNVTNLSKVMSVVEKNTNYSTYDNETGILTLDANYVNEYFRLNPTSDKLIVNYKLTTTEGNSLDFQVFVNEKD